MGMTFRNRGPAEATAGVPSPEAHGLVRAVEDKGAGRMQQLIDRAVRGDVAAFEELVRPHLPGLYRLGAAMVGPDEARDVTQETLMSAWRELRRLKQPDRLESWLRSILMNRARNLLRTRKRHPSISFEPLDGHGSSLVHEPITGLHGQWAAEEALARLRPDERAVLALHYFADLPLRQVAASLGVREGTAKSRLHAGLKTLRSLYAKELA
jgi:RNA polymerase sigma factor (sigma-70 family)